jgi:hypothetical protein
VDPTGRLHLDGGVEGGLARTRAEDDRKTGKERSACVGEGQVWHTVACWLGGRAVLARTSIRKMRDAAVSVMPTAALSKVTMKILACLPSPSTRWNSEMRLCRAVGAVALENSKILTALLLPA